MMRAGRLRHRLLIQRKVEAQPAGGGGDIVFDWEEFASVWGELIPLSGKEFMAAQEFKSEIVARATIRTLVGVDANMRLIYRGVAYNIAAVLPDPTFARHITLMLSQGLNVG